MQAEGSRKRKVQHTKIGASAGQAASRVFNHYLNQQTQRYNRQSNGFTPPLPLTVEMLVQFGYSASGDNPKIFFIGSNAPA